MPDVGNSFQVCLMSRALLCDYLKICDCLMADRGSLAEALQYVDVMQSIFEAVPGGRTDIKIEDQEMKHRTRWVTKLA
jgi:hypothetical protein